MIISDELNHGSIIDGVRLTKASRAVYAHNDMGELEAVLKANESSTGSSSSPTASFRWTGTSPAG